MGKLIELFGRIDGKKFLEGGRASGFAKEPTEEVEVVPTAKLKLIEEYTPR